LDLRNGKWRAFDKNNPIPEQVREWDFVML
jgi:hypothetical protein